MSDDTEYFFLGVSAVCALIVLLLELRDANQLAASYRESAHVSMALAESCAKDLDSAQAQLQSALTGTQPL